MKKLLIILSITLCNSLMAQITLKECIESGLANKANIKSSRTELLLSSLKSIQSKARYWPQISLAYDYRYNPIIATQVVPVGQFNPIPTEETRGIQFGTNWQQNAGITLYQPVIDRALQSRIKESRLNEALSNIDLKKAEEDLTFEIVSAYSRIITLTYQTDEAIADTTRSFQSFSIVRARFEEGKVLKTELNNALVNHNASLTNYKKYTAELINEKIYIHYLTNISLERILDERFAPVPENLFLSGNSRDEIQLDSITDFQKLLAKEKLINQQIKTDRAKYSPVVGLQGFLGANQFSQTFDPVLRKSWFGNSYVGLSVQLPIFSPDKSINGDKQLQTQGIILKHQRDELKAERRKALLQINVEIERLNDEMKFTQNSLALLQQNIKLYQERLQNGQYAASELNVQEAELQKVSNRLKQLYAQLNKALIERLYITGKLTEKLKTI